MNENVKETEENNKTSELHYKRAYLRLFNRVCETINSNVTEMLKEALREAEDICTSDDDDNNNRDKNND